MDLATENRIASILMKEAAELRRQAERDGVDAYLRHPKVRGRPNARFLTATVLGVQQANKAVEVNEMWKIRQKELELDDRLRSKSGESSSDCKSQRNSKHSRNYIRDQNVSHGTPSSSCSPTIRVSETDHLMDDEGLKDEELEKFLHSRVKRGRGAVGPRMDETGPYLPPCNESELSRLLSSNIADRRVICGPERPKSLKSHNFSDDELDNDRRKRSKSSSHKEHKSKHKSDKKRRKESKRSKRH